MGALMRLISPGGAFARHQILIFHRVPLSRDSLMPGEPHQGEFASLMGALKRRFSVLPLPEALDRLAANELPPASLSITFDDGYADNATVAAPILSDLGLSATFFIATGFLDGGRMWNDTVIETVRRHHAGMLDLRPIGLGEHTVNDATRRQVVETVITAIKHRPAVERAELVAAIAQHAGDLPDDLMMTGAQVRALAAAGMTIGGHTVNHPILTRISDEEARQEIKGGKQTLEDLIEAPVDLFAYPNGKPGQDYGPAHVTMVRELGFGAAVSTSPGVSRGDTDRYQLPRFTPWDRSHGRFLLRLLMNRFGLTG